LSTTNGSSKFRPPPSPRSLPIIGHLHHIGSVIPKSFQTLSRQYGPLIQLNLGPSTSIVVSNEQVAKQVMKTHDLKFSYRPQFGSSHDYLYKGSYFITAPYGPYWRFMKKKNALLDYSLALNLVQGRRDHGGQGWPWSPPRFANFFLY